MSTYLSMIAAQNVYGRQDDILDAALASFSVKKLPAWEKMNIREVGVDKKGLLVIAGSWPAKGGEEWSASVAIDPKTGDGTITGHYTFSSSPTSDAGPLSEADRGTLIEKALPFVKSAGPARTALVQLAAMR